MIRKPLNSDVEWIWNLINNEIPNHKVTMALVEKWIEDDCIVVDDSMKAFIKWTKHNGYISADLALTDADSRGRGLSMILFSYIWNTFRKPVQFLVLKDSEQEQYTVFRDEYTKSRTTLLNEFVGPDGNVWRSYAAIDAAWKI